MPNTMDQPVMNEDRSGLKRLTTSYLNLFLLNEYLCMAAEAYLASLVIAFANSLVTLCLSKSLFKKVF